jgi:hypothetical protein
MRRRSQALTGIPGDLGLRPSGGLPGVGVPDGHLAEACARERGSQGQRGVHPGFGDAVMLDRGAEVVVRRLLEQPFGVCIVVWASHSLPLLMSALSRTLVDHT